ncbi:MAG: hypothetical protein AABW79_01400 [Nanoarchaeota archaeon]
MKNLRNLLIATPLVLAGCLNTSEYDKYLEKDGPIPEFTEDFTPDKKETIGIEMLKSYDKNHDGKLSPEEQREFFIESRNALYNNKK